MVDSSDIILIWHSLFRPAFATNTAAASEKRDIMLFLRSLTTDRDFFRLADRLIATGWAGHSHLVPQRDVLETMVHAFDVFQIWLHLVSRIHFEILPWRLNRKRPLAQKSALCSCPSLVGTGGATEKDGAGILIVARWRIYRWRIFRVVHGLA